MDPVKREAGTSMAQVLRPLEPEEFAARMAQFEPFEDRPHIAVAVSGGRDSMALCLLAYDWAIARGGKVTALIVDHGLRAEAADEARVTEHWLAARGIEVEILVWCTADKPRTRVQERARSARYSLLAARCAERGVLHLLIAHHVEDQAETFLQRLLRGSGVEGLAAMAACVELPEVRVLRPLLDVPRTRLQAGLAALGQGWIEDPSNRDPRFARVALRQAGLGHAIEEAESACAAMARLRLAFGSRVTATLAEIASVHPWGSILLEPRLSELPTRLAMAVVSAAVISAGGRDYAPRLARLARTVAGMQAAEHDASGSSGRDTTLGGCRILWRQSQWVVVRDPHAIPNAALDPGAKRWDGRFIGTPITASGTSGGVKPGRIVLSRQQRRAVPGLPVIVAALPSLGGVPLRPAASQDSLIAPSTVPAVQFRPLRPLAAGAFFPCFAATTRQM